MAKEKFKGFFTSTEFRCYICKSPLLDLFDLNSLPLEYRLCCRCRSMIEIFAIRGFNHGDVCRKIDLFVDLIEICNGKIKKNNLSKLNKLIFRLFKRVSIREKENVKDKLRNYFFTMK